MKKLLIAILYTASLTMAGATIEGKWKSDREVGDSDGKTYGHVSLFALKTDGSVVTGTLVATSEAPWMKTTTGKSYEIQAGKVEGEKFSFKIV